MGAAPHQLIEAVPPLLDGPIEPTLTPNSLEPLQDADKPVEPSGDATLPEPADSAEARPNSAYPKFSEVFDAVLKRRIASRQLRPSADRDQLQIKKLWMDIVGDKPIDQYNHSDMSHFMRTLEEMPKIYWKTAADRKLSIHEIIDARKASGDYERMGDKTKNKHSSSIGGVFDLMKKHEYLPRDKPVFWTGHYIRIHKSKREIKEERPAYTDAQIASIFRHPVYTGRLSERFFNSPGDFIVRDSLYWAQLTAAYSMMRREEIASLHVRNIREVKSPTADYSCWCFDLTVKGSKRAKTVAGERVIPIHSALLDLGLVSDWVINRRPDDQLFPELNENNKHRSFGAKLSGRFAQLVDSLNLEIVCADGSTADGAFYPFRHSGTTNLSSSGVPIAVISQLDGHEVTYDEQRSVFSKTTTRYIKDTSVEVTRPHIEKIEHTIEPNALMTAVEDARSKGRLIDLAPSII